MVTIKPITGKDVTVRVPPSKAHTLRSLILGALADGTTTVRNPLLGDDQLHLIECLRGLGVAIDVSEREIVIVGSGGAFSPVSGTLDCGESGVAMNFLSAVANLSTAPVVLTGKESLLRRPIGEIIGGLTQAGCSIEFLSEGGFPPVRVSGGGIAGGEIRMSGAKTSQYFSSLVIASPYAKRDVTVICADDMAEKPYFDITVEMMSRFGVAAANDGYKAISVASGQRYRAAEIDIESDFSSASYFFEIAAISGARVRLEGLCPASVQGDRKIVEYARKLGCSVELAPDAITVTGGSPVPIIDDFGDTPDIVPTVAVAAAFAPGVSVIKNVAHLKFKECDRVAAIVAELGKMGIEAVVEGRDIVIHGDPAAIHGADIRSYGDHRVAMSFACAGLVLPGQTIDDGRCVAKSFPTFWETLGRFQA